MYLKAKWTTCESRFDRFSIVTYYRFPLEGPKLDLWRRKADVGIRSVKIIKWQKEQMFSCERYPRKSLELPVYSIPVSLTTFSSPQTTAAAVKLYRKEDVGVKSTLSRLRVCVTFKPLAVQVDFYLNEVSTGIDPSLSSLTVHI